MSKNSKIFSYGMWISILIVFVYVLIRYLVFYLFDVWEIDIIGLLVSMMVLSSLYFVIRLIVKDELIPWKFGIRAVYYMLLSIVINICMNSFVLPSLDSHLLRVCSFIAFSTACNIFIYYFRKEGAFEEPNVSLLTSLCGAFVGLLIDEKTRTDIANKLSFFSVIYFIFFALLMVNQQCYNGEYYNMLIPTSLISKLPQTLPLTKALYVWPKVIFCILDKLLFIPLIHSISQVSSRLSWMIESKIVYEKYRKDNPEEFE